jgi:hypothetical protein
MQQIVPIHVCVIPDTADDGPTLLATMTHLFTGIYEVRGYCLESGEVFWIRRGSWNAAQMNWRRLTGGPVKEGRRS